MQRLESGEAATQLSGFVGVCRVLGLVVRLDALLPEPAASPLQQLKPQGRRRKRASGKRIPTAKSGEWSWSKP